LGSFTTVHGNNIIDASLGTASFIATTAPIKMRLMTANGNGTTAGTEVTGGSYVSQSVTFTAAGSLSTANTGAVSFTNMPSCTVVGGELWDSSGTPVRKHFGPLAAPKTVNPGDTFTLPAGSIVLSLT